MIVPITGKVTYPITLDPTVWIFDDRKIEFEKAFESEASHSEESDELKRVSERWDREVSQLSKPPVNRSIKKFEREKMLKSSYVIPLDDFLNNAEIEDEATSAILVTKEGDITIPISDLYNSYFLFSKEGKPLHADGPVHLYYKDGSNRENPIKHIMAVRFQ
ncbi:hypothetical protein [Virgibacillus salexigens]|uniref:Peptidyl-prolyl cis-trans isomerase n=1 Tax=Virgibacillus massiliensis TaxID=1462526 RepID=A0A024QDE7_9BACI|nr:hypothetical protein [Virgibacillus massiliensis]CDQ40245.1 hypothetical protein BN990_02565 [Virgibacillus massiliensis]